MQVQLQVIWSHCFFKKKNNNNMTETLKVTFEVQDVLPNEDLNEQTNVLNLIFQAANV